MKTLHQNIAFSSNFYPTAKKIIYLLENIEKLPADEFAGLYLNLELSLKQGNAEINDSATEYNVPFQQLTMISQVLPQLYDVLKK